MKMEKKLSFWQGKGQSYSKSNNLQQKEIVKYFKRGHAKNKGEALLFQY